MLKVGELKGATVRADGLEHMLKEAASVEEGLVSELAAVHADLKLASSAKHVAELSAAREHSKKCGLRVIELEEALELATTSASTEVSVTVSDCIPTFTVLHCYCGLLTQYSD